MLFVQACDKYTRGCPSPFLFTASDGQRGERELEIERESLCVMAQSLRLWYILPHSSCTSVEGIR